MTLRAQKVESPGDRHPALRCHRTLLLRNRQRLRSLDMRLLRRIAQALLARAWPEGSLDLALYVVTRPEITRLNEAFLRHKGPTDVITFDYSLEQASRLSGDRRDACPTAKIFICLEEAVSQGRRFHATWQSELVRYIVHGILHLLGYDDRAPRSRREMKKAEDALLRELAGRFDFRRLERA